jgi:hypothetical protein
VACRTRGFPVFSVTDGGPADVFPLSAKKG